MKATALQTQIARQLGIDVSTDSFRVAIARIMDIVGPAIGDKPKHFKPTPKQLKFANELGIHIADESFRVCSAKIQDKLEELNLKTLEEMQLAPGDRVLVREIIDYKGRHHVSEQEYVVSSIKDNGMVYFKGGGGRCTWARKLKKEENRLVVEQCYEIPR
jgi:hypothetical protein